MPTPMSFEAAFHGAVLTLIEGVALRNPAPDSPEGKFLAVLRSAAANYEKERSEAIHDNDSGWESPE